MLQERDSTDPMLQRAYVFHLVVPLLVLLDVLHAARFGMAGRSDLVLGGIAGLWLCAALAALALARDRRAFLMRIRGPLTSFYAVVFLLVVLEGGLRLIRGPVRATLWKPSTVLAYEPPANLLPGVSGVAHFRVNELGMRGPSLPAQPGVYKIVTVGGSTTVCLVLDDSEEWPHRLMEEMNAREKARPVWVANAGVQGHTAVHHLALLETLPELRRMDLLIFLPGINDLQNTLRFEGGASQAFLESEAAEFRQHILSGAEDPYPLYRHLQLYQVVRRASNVIVKHSSFQKTEIWDEIRLREQRARMPSVLLPELSTGVREYRERIVHLGQKCHELGTRCIFLTQPTLWRENLPHDEQQWLLFGWVGPKAHPKGYLSPADGKRALEAFNTALLDACREQGLECYDLAAVVPKDLSAFYDDVHFNEGGARIVAAKLADYLLAKPPFSAGERSSVLGKRMVEAGGVGIFARIKSRQPIETVARRRR